MRATQLFGPGPEAAREALRALRHTFNLRLRIAFTGVIAAIRPTLIPLFILCSVAGAAVSAQYLQHYLHLVSDVTVCSSVNIQHTCQVLQTEFPQLKYQGDYQTMVNQAQELELTYLVIALVAMIIATIALTLAMLGSVTGRTVEEEPSRQQSTDQSSSQYPTGDSSPTKRKVITRHGLVLEILPLGTAAALGRLAVIGVAILVTIWPFRVLLWGVNVVLAAFTPRRPFYGVGWITLVSFTAFVISLAVVLYQYQSQRRR
jgi:hypothetical protein